MAATLDWYGCATFRLRVNGLTIFLDAYVDRVAGAPGSGLTAGDIDECDWIVIGHSHFDHLYGAERIAANTSCRIIGSMICVPGGERIDLGDGGALVYLFETPDGTVLYQDTSGHWTGVLRDLRPDGAILAAAGRGNIDGEPIQGSLAEFVARQAKLVRARRVVLSHHDDWLPGFSIDTDIKPIRAALERLVPRPELFELGYVDGTEIL